MVEAGEGWRFLKAGEETGPGDECRTASDPTDSWTMVQRIGQQAHGLVYRSRFNGPTPEPDPVNHPPHYNAGAIECIDAIRAALGREGFIAYCRGNALKYAWRSEHKGGSEDLAKAAWYLNRAITEETR